MEQVIVVGILAAVGGGAIAAFISGMFQSPRTKAEAAKLIAEQGQTIDGRWEKWSNELEDRLAKERTEHRQQLDELRLQAQEEVQRLSDRLSKVEKKLEESEEKVAELRSELDSERRTTQRLRSEVNREKKVTRSVIAWAITLRDEVRVLGGTVPDTPKLVEDYINEMGEDPPREPDHSVDTP